MPGDLFSAQASAYARHRPAYPDALFAALAVLAPARDLAWDCGTGSGQAAVGLAAHVRHVVATDVSADQLSHARPCARVEYRLAPAEHSGLADGSVDLVTAAQALHWFDLDAFYNEVRRVLRPGGLLAAWCYHHPVVSPAVDSVLVRYYDEVVGPYWDPRVRLVDAHYLTVPFPFPEVEVPTVEGETFWTLADALGYLDSWSATQAYLRARGTHPVEEVRQDLAAAWGDPEARLRVRWPLHVRAGRMHAAERETYPSRLEG